MTGKWQRKPFAQRLNAGLSEAVEFAKGELTLRIVQVPDPPPEIAAMKNDGQRGGSCPESEK